MQGFTKLRQARIQERQQAKQDFNNWRMQRSLEFQQEVKNTHAMLDAATQNRLASEQARRDTEAIEQAQRRQEVIARHQSVQTELQHNEAQRLATARHEAALRLKALKERIAATHVQLAKFSSDRLIMSIADQQKRLKEFQALKTQTQAFLKATKSDRLQMSAQQQQQLADYVTYIHLSVWGMDYDTIIQESRTEETIYTSTPSLTIEDFINNYITQLPDCPTLTQVVNDRTAVKELLTTGTATLKVDPSEILNTLIKMVDLDN